MGSNSTPRMTFFSEATRRWCVILPNWPSLTRLKIRVIAVCSWSQLSRILHTANLTSSTESEEVRVSTLPFGFCNSVYSVTLPAQRRGQGRSERRLVIKIFTRLSKLRIEAGKRAQLDVVASEGGLGPSVVHVTSEAIVHDYVPGRSLTEDDLAGNRTVALLIAEKLAKLHDSPLPPSFAGAEPVLWSSIAKMLDHIALQPELLPPPFTLDMLQHECENARLALEGVPLKVVTGHGDFKPSNIMMAESNSDVMFIDFELAGPNYRGFDIFKLFRRGQPSSGGEAEPMSHQNLRAFVSAYLSHLAPENRALSPGPSSGGATGREDLERVLTEVYLFEPLTWLEAAVFFLFAIQEVRYALVV